MGDDLYVTGTLGLAALGMLELRAGRKAGAAVRRFLVPPSRVGIGQALGRTGLVGGMLDVSDGFLKDLGHLCTAAESAPSSRLRVFHLPPCIGELV